MRFVSVDIETTGLDVTAKDSMILSVGMIVDDLENPLPYEELPKIHVMLNHRSTVLRGDIQALTMNAALLSRIQRLGALRFNGGITSGEVEGVSLLVEADCAHGEYLLFLMEAGFQIQNFMRKNFPYQRVVVAGKNVGSFDLPFMAATWADHMTTLIPQHAVMDPAILYMLPSDQKVPNLALCKERAGFTDTEVAHDALADAWDVCRLLRHKFCKEPK